MENKAGYIPDRPIEELNELLRDISSLSDNDLLQVMSAVSNGLIRKKREAMERSVDMEIAVAILAGRNTPKKSSWKHIRDNLIKPYEENLRAPQLMGLLDKRIGKES